jgi:uncharacterized protein with PQ loop repeat
MDEIIRMIGMVAGVVMPLFNIPMIMRIVRRRSSADISLTWVLGVWFCILLMTPSALKSDDLVFRAFGMVNLLFFTCVMLVVLWYRRKRNS